MAQQRLEVSIYSPGCVQADSLLLISQFWKARL